MPCQRLAARTIEVAAGRPHVVVGYGGNAHQPLAGIGSGVRTWNEAPLAAIPTLDQRLIARAIGVIADRPYVVGRHHREAVQVVLPRAEVGIRRHAPLRAIPMLD